jgi:Rrf2 family protein
MRITARGEYAVRAVVAAAQHTTDAPVTAAMVAQAQHIPLGFLYSIMMDLRRAGLIATYRGSGGGYRLARPAEAISIGDVLRSVDDGVNQLSSVPPVPNQRDSGIDQLWSSVRQAIAAVVDHTTIADLVGDGRERSAAS